MIREYSGGVTALVRGLGCGCHTHGCSGSRTNPKNCKNFHCHFTEEKPTRVTEEVELVRVKGLNFQDIKAGLWVTRMQLWAPLFQGCSREHNYSHALFHDGDTDTV